MWAARRAAQAAWQEAGRSLLLRRAPAATLGSDLYPPAASRLSNFLLWQSAYSELVFIPTYWPDFDRAALEQAIDEFHRRERRFGGLVAQTGS